MEERKKDIALTVLKVLIEGMHLLSVVVFWAHNSLVKRSKPANKSRISLRTASSPGFSTSGGGCPLRLSGSLCISYTTVVTRGARGRYLKGTLYLVQQRRPFVGFIVLLIFVRKPHSEAKWAYTFEF